MASTRKGMRIINAAANEAALHFSQHLKSGVRPTYVEGEMLNSLDRLMNRFYAFAKAGEWHPDYRRQVKA